MSDARHIHGFVLLVAAALALAGCGSTVDMVPEKLGAAERRATAPGHDPADPERL